MQVVVRFLEWLLSTLGRWRATPESAPQPVLTTTQLPSIDPEVAFRAGFDFFEVPSMDGNLDDSAPTESFTTKFGVTEMTYADALKVGVVTLPWEQVHTPADVEPIYRHQFYDADRCGQMPPCVGMVVFVDATLMGNSTPVRNLQHILGVAEDGRVGVQTLSELLRSDPRNVATLLEAADLAHLRTLPNWSVYKNGWTKREESLLTAALRLS